MRYLKNNSTDPYFNMAFDEFCLEQLTIENPVFYLWQNQPSVIMGANQEVNTEVNLDFLKEHSIKLVRRVSGGGTVYHDLGNLNYTIVGRSKDLETDYPEYTQYMLQALQSLGIPATLSGRNDILVKGRKVSGFAKRVCHDRLMVHGTLMFDVDMDILSQVLCPTSSKLQSKGVSSVRSRVTNLSHYLPQMSDICTFKQELEKILSNNYEDKEYLLSTEDIQSIQQLANEKFASKEWIYGHSPRATMKHSARFACGTIEINLTLNGNCIEFCTFGGDFLGNLPVSTIEDALKGIPYDYTCIQNKLLEFSIDNYFDGLSTEDLLKLIL